MSQAPSMCVHFAAPVHLVKCKWIFRWVFHILSITNRKKDWFLTWYINHSGVIRKVNLFIKCVLNIYYGQGTVWCSEMMVEMPQRAQSSSSNSPVQLNCHTLQDRELWGGDAHPGLAGERENTEYQSQCWECSPKFFPFKGNWLFKNVFSLKSGGTELIYTN